MLFILVIIIGILFLNVQVAGTNEFHTDYCNPKQTATINGIFTIFIFLSHASGYVQLGGVLDEPYLALQKYMGQMVVASFLFYTGFGMMESIKKKGVDYIKGIPFKRFFKVWYHFAVAIVLFLISNTIFGIRHDKISQVLLSFTGYKSIGNSNWYMFVTFAMYIIIFVAFIIFRDKKWLGLIATFGLTVAFIILEIKLDLPSRFFNTIMCVPVGMLFSMIKPLFDKIVMKNDIIWAGATAIVFAAYYYFHSNKGDTPIHHNIFAILSVVFIMMLLMKVKVGNKILDFFANHIFSIFILQRIPMMILEKFGFTDHKYSFIIVSFIATVFIALVFDWAMEQTDKLIYSKKA